MAVLQALKDILKTFAELSDRTLNNNNLLHVAKNAVRIDFVCDAEMPYENISVVLTIKQRSGRGLWKLILNLKVRLKMDGKL